ncbi:MAG: hypothetical protein ACI4XR_05630, partial [Bacilli bacterium]
ELVVLKNILKKIWFIGKRLLFYIFSLILVFAILFLFIHIIFREPDITTLSDYINNFTIVIYIILALFAIYIVFYIKNNKFKLFEIIIMFLIIGVIILPIIYNEGKKQYLKVRDIKQGKVLINKYLTNYFDRNDYNILYSGKRIALFTSSTYCYEINNKVMDYTFEIELNTHNLEFAQNTLIDSFLEKNKIERYNALNTYLKILEVLPLNVEVNADITEIDFKKISNDFTMLNILKNATYDLDSFNIQLDTLDKNEIIKLSKKLFIIYKDYIYNNKEDNIIRFYIQKNDKSYAYGEINEKLDNVLFLDFRTYNNSEIELKFSEVIIN